ncbi:MAG: penicillin-binding transpeptidase domain-containing protein, partial [Nesterenkonia sp.]
EAEFQWIFANSCNTPFAEAAMELGEGPIRDAAESFGWNDPDVSIPLGLTTSVFPELTGDAELALSAIGQLNVTATAMQMNMVAASIANDGEMMQPQLVDIIRGSDLQVLQQSTPEVLNDVMDSSTAADMTDMMVQTVESGTAQGVQSSRFDVAAKTGTAERGDEEDQTVNSWITGFAPADDPQYAVTVVYEGIDMGTGTQLTRSQMLTMLEAVIEE